LSKLWPQPYYFLWLQKNKYYLAQLAAEAAAADALSKNCHEIETGNKASDLVSQPT